MGPTSDHDDLRFAHELAAGDARAVLAFEGRYRSVVRHALGTALRRWRPESPVEPEDFVQDFVGFLFGDGGRRLSSYAGRASFGAWLYTVALRYFQRALARNTRDRRGDLDAVIRRLPDQQGRDPEFAVMAAQQAERLRAAVRTLPPSDQLYVRLFFVEGLNAAEVARTLGKGGSGVRMRKMRILAQLKELVDSEEQGQEVGT